MFIRIIRNDLKLLFADKTLWIVSLLFAVLIGFGVFNGTRWSKERTRQVDQLVERGEKAINDYRHELKSIESGLRPFASTAPAASLPTGKSYPATLPPAPLSVLSLGQSDIYPFNATIDVYSVKHAIFNFYEQDNPVNLLAGRFDLAFVFVFLLPLLVLALSYNVLSQEKEGGTLQMSLAQSPLSVRKLVLTKIAARLIVVLLLVFGLSLTAMLLGGVALNSQTAPRILLSMLAGILYAVFWFALAVAVNSFGSASATNAVILVGVWIILVVVIPSLLNLVATSMHPVPSRLEFISKLREADNYTRSQGQNLLAKYYGDHPELVPAGQLDLNEFTRRFYAVRQENERRVLPEVSRFEQQLAQQQKLINRYRILTPAVVMQDALNDIAGTGAARQQSFVAQVRAFMDQWQQFFVPKVMKKAPLTAADYDLIPRFRFEEETQASVAGRVSVCLLTLFLPSLLIIALAAWRLKHFSVVG